MDATTPAVRPKIVVLDGYTLNPGDLSWEDLNTLGELRVFEYSTQEQALERAKDAAIVLTNKLIIDASFMTKSAHLKCICLMSTGYDVIDVAAAKARGIAVCNAVGYGSDSVAQHVFALLLELTNQVGAHHASVQKGDWARNRDFSYTLNPIIGLAGKIMGIYGLGRIGQKVAEIALAFGMHVIAHHKHPERDARPGVQFVALDNLFKQSDVLSLHAPLSTANEGLVNSARLQQMKPSSYLINTGRGGLVLEADLKEALEQKWIAGAGLDVLAVEPPSADHVFYNLDNCIITPHNAWANKTARQKLMNTVVENVKCFLAGKVKNNVY